MANRIDKRVMRGPRWDRAPSLRSAGASALPRHMDFSTIYPFALLAPAGGADTTTHLLGRLLVVLKWACPVAPSPSELRGREMQRSEKPICPSAAVVCLAALLAPRVCACGQGRAVRSTNCWGGEQQSTQAFGSLKNS